MLTFTDLYFSILLHETFNFITIFIFHSYYITALARVLAAPRFLGQEFGNNNNSYISGIRFYLCESKIFAIAFVALWLSLAAFTVICQ
jgi:hypothetical protein